MRGQASVELILIVAITVVLGFLVLVKYTNSHEGIFINATARQALIQEIGSLDTKYTLENVQSALCGSGQNAELRISVIMQPGTKAGDCGRIANKVATAVSLASGRSAQAEKVYFNQPEALKCTTITRQCP
ncbi:MAG: hypothetical protein HY544_03350 [Candidatus Diapherotrites archaeon]|uniref:Class III signal peptide-containing protein n=1 Tax=Candidatus Iainarchaeum sp. TaxID=3101447 RepID=A0A8T3YJ14_9ARCH|nr:hypothetical protein [Candidatus Diapherotrites archaeon]